MPKMASEAKTTDSVLRLQNPDEQSVGGTGSDPKDKDKSVNVGTSARVIAKPKSTSSAGSSKAKGSRHSSASSSSSTASKRDSSQEKHGEVKKARLDSGSSDPGLKDTIQSVFKESLREMMEAQMAMFASMQQQQQRACARDLLAGGSSRERGAPLRADDDLDDSDGEGHNGPPVLEPIDPPTGMRKKGGGRNHRDRMDHEISDDDDLDLDADVEMVTRDENPDDNNNNQDGDDGVADAGDDFDDALDQLAEDFGGDDLTGKPVSDKLANIVNKIVRAKLGKEKLKDKLNDEAYRKPANCQNLTVPKINLEMLSKIKPSVRSNDIKTQRLQHMLQKAMVPIILMYDELRTQAKQKPGTNPHLAQGQGLPMATMAKYAADALALMANLNFEMTQNRKDSIRWCLNGQYKQICAESKPFTDQLFGDNLPATLRDIGATSRVTNQAAVGNSGQYQYKKGPNSKNGRGRGHSQWQQNQWQQSQWQNRRPYNAKNQYWQNRGYNNGQNQSKKKAQDK